MNYLFDDCLVSKIDQPPKNLAADCNGVLVSVEMIERDGQVGSISGNDRLIFINHELE
jgi:hypothetical protein